MKKIANLVLIGFVMFGLLLSINLLTATISQDKTVIDKIIVNVDSQGEDNIDNSEGNASTNDVIIVDDTNPDGVFLLGVEPKNNSKQ